MDNMLSNDKRIKHGNGWDYLMMIIVTCIIIIRHASLPDWLDRGYETFDSFGNWLIKYSEICLPLFFAFSGLFFFRGIPAKNQKEWFVERYKKGLTSVIIPYLIVNILTLAVYFLAQKWAPGMMSGYMGDNWKNPLFIFWKGPINLSLWFVRELIIMIVAAPLLWMLIRYTWGIFVIIIGILWGLQIAPQPMFWFCLGSLPAIFPKPFRAITEWLDNHPIRIGEEWKQWAWFVYLYHYIPQIVMKKVGILLLPSITSGGLIAVWLSNAIILIASLSLIYLLLRRFTPGILTVLVGGK